MVKKIKCKCGHAKDSHSFGAGWCYHRASFGYQFNCSCVKMIAVRIHKDTKRLDWLLSNRYEFRDGQTYRKGYWLFSVAGEIFGKSKRQAIDKSMKKLEALNG